MVEQPYSSKHKLMCGTLSVLRESGCVFPVGEGKW